LSDDPTLQPRPAIGQLARGAWYGLWVQGVDKILPVALMLYLARTLEPNDFGVYAFVVAYLALFQILSEYSVDTVLVRAISQSPARAVALVHAGLSLKLVLALVSVAVAVVTVGLVSAGHTPWSLMFVASLSLPTALGGAYRAYFRATLDIRSVFFIAGTRALLVSAAVIVAVLAHAGLIAVFAAMASANLLTFLLVSATLRRRIDPRVRFDPDLWRELFRGALPLVINALAMTVSLRAGQIMLMSLRGPIEVGRMSAASRIVEAFTLLPEALMLTVYPLMAGLHARKSAALFDAAGKSSRYLTLAAGVPVLLCAIAGDAIMRLLFGEEFADAGRILALLAWTALLAATGTVILNLLIAAHHERTLYRNNVVFAAVNVALSAALIPKFGELGAACAILIASAGSQVALACLPGTGAYARAVLLPALRTFAAVAVAASVVVVTEFELVARIVFAAVAYVAALAAFGVINREELRFIRTVVDAAAGARGR
jgi:O-antigen/teichoic acid export membrane protein